MKPEESLAPLDPESIPAGPLEPEKTPGAPPSHHPTEAAEWQETLEVELTEGQIIYPHTAEDELAGMSFSAEIEPDEGPLPAEGGESPYLGTAIIKNETLNIREMPGTNAPILGQFVLNDQAPVLARVNEWYKISYKDGTAYIYARYVRLDLTTKPYIDPTLVEKIQQAALATSKPIKVNPVHIQSILEACTLFGVEDPAHLAYVLATVHFESHWGDWMTEFADGTAYEGRQDLGNTQPGDGPRYKGRGYVQMTGRINYHNFGAFFDVPLEAQPELATDPTLSAKISLYGMVYGTFTSRKLADFGAGDSYDFYEARTIINAHAAADQIADIARVYYQALK